MDRNTTIVQDLFKKFKRGCDFFNREMLFGGMNPYLGRKSREFDREVVRPFDEACQKATKTELQEAGVL